MRPPLFFLEEITTQRISIHRNILINKDSQGEKVKLCKNCQIPIPVERLAILPDTEECVKCSSVERLVGFMDFGHKTAGECVAVDPRNKENLRRANRINERAR